MLFYFSGTGNSTFMAVTLGNFLSLKPIFIPETNPKKVENPEERLIFVFPVYSWGVPPLVLQFIKDLGKNFWERVKEKGLPIDCVMTCGDEVALAPEMIEKQLNKMGVKLQSVWSVIMPNNYVLLPGFDVDSKTLEKQKLSECEGRILEIAEGIRQGIKGYNITRGSIPWLKTRIVYPLFKKWGVFPRKWHFTLACISCGQCAKICPMMNVRMQKEHPVWGTRCCSCLGCYHVCPVHAVEYGKATKKKGQYLFPLKKISSRNYHKI